MNMLVQLAKDMALTWELDPALVCGIIAQESEWNTWLSRYEPAFFDRYLNQSRMRGTIKEFAHNAPYTLSFETELRERSFSRGLMQVMGQTAREMNYKDPLPRLHNPETGLAVGCKYLHRMIQKRAGDVRAGLLLYNGGGNLKYPDIVLELAENYR